MSPIQRPETLTTAVVNHIADAILTGEFPPGSALPEVPLAQSLETSRGTVREALRTLRDLGLVTILPHHGASVASLSLSKAEEIVSLRSLLEGAGARWVVERGCLTADVLRNVEDAFQAFRDVSRHNGPNGGLASTHAIEADLAFHWKLVEPCGHELLLQHLTTLHMQTRLLLYYIHAFEADVDSAVASHEPILAALRRGDPDRLETTVREHIAASGKRLLRGMEQRMPVSP